MKSPTIVAVAAAAVFLAACQGNPAHRQPVGPDDGLQLTGRIEGKRVNVSDGEPEVTLGACEAAPPGREALCLESFTIDGDPFTLVVVGPEVFVEGATVEVLAHCFGDGCTEVALVDVVLGGNRSSAQGGELVVDQAGPRYVARLSLRFAGGNLLTGRFNVLPA
ncbi:MAG: hypothetical protein ACRDUY_14060, partial [Nitriliruptorales bacterium]